MTDDRPAWVYTHYAADDAVLYVGCTIEPARRWVAHRNGSPWFPQVASVGVLGPFPRAAALALEARLIELHQPPHNTIGTVREVSAHALTGAMNRYITERCRELAEIAERQWIAGGRFGSRPDLNPGRYRDWVRRNLTEGDRENVRESLVGAA